MWMQRPTIIDDEIKMTPVREIHNVQSIVATGKTELTA